MLTTLTQRLNVRGARLVVAAAITLVCLSFIAIPVPMAHAHGLEIDTTLTPVVAVRLDLTVTDVAGEEPLDDADVTVHAPGQDAPWLETRLGKKGALSLVPDVGLPGLWTVRIQGEDASATLELPLDFGADYARIASGAAVTLAAEGANVSYTLTEIVTVVVGLDAQFEGGETLSDAQVTVYAPDNAKTPWLRGTADGDGHFAFVADITNAGTWEIQVRKAGHGEWIKLPLDAATVEAADISQDSAADGGNKSDGGELRVAASASASSDDGYTTGQIVLMSASVVWGLVGTALYFARRRDESHSSSTERA